MSKTTDVERSLPQRASPPDYALLLDRTRHAVARAHHRDELLRHVCEELAAAIPYYDWVGFYLVDLEFPQELVLGPFVGAPTEHVRIPFGRGICGQSAKTQRTVLVQDVSLESNYLACSTATRSELVVPLFAGNMMVGQIDVDSHALAPFTAHDQEFLEELCDLIGARWQALAP